MKKKAISFGEMLWDVFPDATVPGGATLNVALRLSSLGVDTAMISAVGKESEGQELLEIMKNAGVDTSLVQIHDTLETGKVHVTLDEKGNGTYSITDPAAWDEIAISEDMITAVKEADAIIFGSMGSRRPVSRKTLQLLLKHARFKVFDINLRPPHYSFEIINQLLQLADLVKLNDDELVIYARQLGFYSNDLEDVIKLISVKNENLVLCITKGENGAIIAYRGQYFEHPGFRVSVADTVGAGDGFLAGLVSRHLAGDNWADALAYACAVGALVASKPTANPPVSEEEIRNLLRTN